MLFTYLLVGIIFTSYVPLTHEHVVHVLGTLGSVGSVVGAFGFIGVLGLLTFSKSSPIYPLAVFFFVFCNNKFPSSSYTSIKYLILASILVFGPTSKTPVYSCHTPLFILYSTFSTLLL